MAHRRPRPLTDTQAIEKVLGALNAERSASPERRTPHDGIARLQRILARLKKEAPAILKVMVMKSAIEVAVDTYTIDVDGKTLKGRLAQMIAGGFFDNGATGQAAFDDLVRRGAGPSKPNVYKELDSLATLGFVTNEGKGVGYKAVPDMKINIKRK